MVNISLIFVFIRLMKKFFTIPLALLILLSGMHFTFATHYCGGKIAATKVSLSGEEATCGMIHGSDNSSETRISRHCCDDELVVYKIDSDYSPSSFQFKEITLPILLEFHIPVKFSLHSDLSSVTNTLFGSPPDYNPANAVSMADICVFRI